MLHGEMSLAQIYVCASCNDSVECFPYHGFPLWEVDINFSLRISSMAVVRSTVGNYFLSFPGSILPPCLFYLNCFPSLHS